MQTKNRISAARKFLYGMMVVGLVWNLVRHNNTLPVSAQEETPETGQNYIVKIVAPDANELPDEALEAIKSALSVWPDLPPENNTFYLINIYWNTWWGIATLTSANLERPLENDEESHLNYGNLISVLFIYTEEMSWKAALDVDPNIEAYLRLIPESELSISARAAIFPPPSQIRQEPEISAQQVYNNYKFPWPAGNPWRLTNGWHDSTTWGGQFPTNHSLDFDINIAGANSDILASAPGTVTYRCNDGVQVLLVVTTDGTSEKLGYLHLDAATVSANVGTPVNQGTNLGRMKNSDPGPISSSCGTTNRTHIHIYFPSKPFIMDNTTFSDSSLPWNIDLYSSQGNNPPPSQCNPNSDQVALYEHANYGGACVVKGVGNYPNPGSLGIANDSISSVKVGGNVKLTLCRDDNYIGTCETFLGDDSDLSNNSIGNDQASSAKVETRCALTSIPSGYNQCAEEGGFCSFSGTANVIYGANSCYTSPRSFSNGTACNNDVFGDPLPGVRKYCYTNGSGSGGSWAYQLFDLGDYNGDKYESNQTITNLTNVGWNDRAESIKINSGYEIIACEHADFQGNCGRVTGPAQFSDINALAQGLRNGLSSIKVCSGSCPNPPSAPSLISPSNGQYFNEGENITLSWTATGSEYYGEIWGGPGGTLTFGWQSGSSKSIGSQWAGYTYSWHVKARNSVGESGWSSTWNFTVRPAAPTNLSASAVSCSQVNLSWSDNSGNEEGYKVYRNGNLIATLGTGVTSYQDTGLSASTTYSYTVKAFRGNIESNASNTASVTTTSCGPGAPTLNSPANNATINRTDSVSLFWNAATGATQYYAEFWGGPGTNINSTWISGTSWSLGSQWGGVYQWRVKAKNSSGQESGWSETRTLNIKPGTPSNLTASVLSSDQIKLTWNASSDAPGNIDGYRIYRNGSAVATVNGSTTTYQNNGLSCNTSYSFFVRAYKGTIESNSSNTVNATTQPCPPAIRATAADTRDGNWELKTSFNPGDTIQWTIHVENTTGADAQVVLGFTVKNPSNVVIHNSTYTVTTGAGTWMWGLPATVELPGGIYTFIGSVTYQGVTTQRTATYSVSGAAGASFQDVPTTHPYYRDIEILYANGLTAGCSTSPPLFCPETTLDRAQAAVFMLRGSLGITYTPPEPPFVNPFLDDWGPGAWAQKWAQGMLQEGLTAGCSSSPLLYCPWEKMTRIQAAVFGVRLKNGNAYLPPPATGAIFADITDPNLWYAKWAEQAYNDGLLPACGTQGGKPLFCPNNLVSRGLGAYMIVRAKNLTMP